VQLFQKHLGIDISICKKVLLSYKNCYRAVLLSLSLVMEFLRIVFTNIILEKVLSHEALVTERVTAVSNNLYKQSHKTL